MFGNSAFGVYPFSTVKTVVGTYRSLFATNGVYTVNGNNANLIPLHHYSLSGNAGGYVVTGASANLAYLSNYTLVCTSGSYAITGKIALLHLAKTFPADTGTYSIYGGSATFRIDHKLTCINGAYVITGKPSTLIHTNRYRLICNNGSYAITGRNANLLLNKKLALGNGTYTVAGTSANLLYQIGVDFNFVSTSMPELILNITDNYDIMMVSSAITSD